MKCLRTSGKTNNSDITFSDTSEQASEDTSEPKQIALSAALKRPAPLPSNSPRYFSLLRAIMNFVFQTIEYCGRAILLYNLLQLLSLNFQLPHHTLITRKFCLKLTVKFEQELRDS